MPYRTRGPKDILNNLSFIKQSKHIFKHISFRHGQVALSIYFGVGWDGVEKRRAKVVISNSSGLLAFWL